MTDNHKDGANTHGNIGRLVQIGKVDGSVTIQDTLESFACCPICNRNDEVKKVSAIVANQTQSMQGITIEKGSYKNSDGKWHTSTEKVPFSGTQSSVLAMKLQSPAQPNAQKLGIGWYVGCFFAIAFLIEGVVFISMIFQNDTEYLFAGILALVFSWFLMRWCVKKVTIYKQSLIICEQELPKWQKAMGRWRKLYYCFRNDCVFIPDEMTYAEADSIKESD